MTKSKLFREKWGSRWGRPKGSKLSRANLVGASESRRTRSRNRRICREKWNAIEMHVQYCSTKRVTTGSGLTRVGNECVCDVPGRIACGMN